MIEVPRGIEVLVKKAAVDAAFRDFLLSERDGAAARIGLVLEPAEAAMLRAIPAAQLAAVVANTTVPPRFRAAFMGYAAAAMLAAVGALSACKPGSTGNDKLPEILGINSDEIREKKIDIPLFQMHKDKVVFKGRVVDSRGKPLPNIQVTIYKYEPDNKRAPRLGEENPRMPKTVTDQDGLYELEPLTPGKYKIMCKKISDDSVYFSAWYEGKPGELMIVNFIWGNGHPLPRFQRSHGRPEIGRYPSIDGIRPDYLGNGEK